MLPCLAYTGLERQLYNLAPALVSSGHDVRIAYVRGAIPPGVELTGVKLHHLKARGSYDPILCIRFLKLVSRIRPDLIQTWSLPHDVMGGFVARISNVPWVIREPSSTDSNRKTWKERLRIRVARSVDAVVSNSHGGDAYWQGFLPPRRRYLIRNGIALEAIEGTQPAVRSDLGIAVDEKLVIYAGRLSPEKNVIPLVEALAHIAQTARITALLCGDGPDEQAIADRIATLTPAHSIRLMGVVPSQKLWGLMKCADASILPSDYEGFPNAVVEAMACGCAIVVSDIPAHREFLDEHSAVFVRQKDPNSIAQGLMRIFQSKEETNRRILRARAIASEWSIKRMATEYERVYLDVLRHRQALSDNTGRRKRSALGTHL